MQTTYCLLGPHSQLGRLPSLATRTARQRAPGMPLEPGGQNVLVMDMAERVLEPLQQAWRLTATSAQLAVELHEIAQPPRSSSQGVQRLDVQRGAQGSQSRRDARLPRSRTEGAARQGHRCFGSASSEQNTQIRPKSADVGVEQGLRQTRTAAPAGIPHVTP